MRWGPLPHPWRAPRRRGRLQREWAEAGPGFRLAGGVIPPLGRKFMGTDGRATSLARIIRFAAQPQVAPLVAAAERGQHLVADGAGRLGQRVHALVGAEDERDGGTSADRSRRR